VSVRKLLTNGIESIFLVPDLACQAIPLTVRTDGILKIGPMATEVPSIGANLSLVVGKEQMKPIPLVDSLPRYYRLVPRATSSNPQAITHSSGNDNLRIALSDLELTPSSDGLWLSSNLHLSLVKMEDSKPSLLTSDQMATSARDSLAKTRPLCAQDTRFELLVGNIAIGNGNEVVKFFEAAAKVLGDAKRATDKAADDARKAVEKAADDAARAAAKAADDAKRATDKAADDARKAAEKAKDDAARAAAKAAKDGARASADGAISLARGIC
jgi:hypothetical protein